MRYMLLLAAACLLVSCATTNSASSASLVGVWTDCSIDASFTLEMVDGDLRLVSSGDWEESFTIIASGERGDTFYWTVEVPSTGYILTYEVVGVDGDKLLATWSNQYGGGGETLYRTKE